MDRKDSILSISSCQDQFLIYRFNAIKIKVPASYFMDINKLTLYGGAKDPEQPTQC